jgi:hypothetical protein
MAPASKNGPALASLALSSVNQTDQHLSARSAKSQTAKFGLDVGLSRVPHLFVLMLTPDSKIRRACLVQWRSGHLPRAKFLSAREIRRHSAEAKMVN